MMRYWFSIKRYIYSLVHFISVCIKVRMSGEKLPGVVSDCVLSEKVTFFAFAQEPDFLRLILQDTVSCTDEKFCLYWQKRYSMNWRVGDCLILFLSPGKTTHNQHCVVEKLVARALLNPISPYACTAVKLCLSEQGSLTPKEEEHFAVGVEWQQIHKYWAQCLGKSNGSVSSGCFLSFFLISETLNCSWSFREWESSVHHLWHYGSPREDTVPYLRSQGFFLVLSGLSFCT
jgi:hypothetical protein